MRTQGGEVAEATTHLFEEGLLLARSIRLMLGNKWAQDALLASLHKIKDEALSC
jgi:hypothetical protein